MKKHVISVITPLHSEPVSFLERNLRSVAAQETIHSIEQIVVLDAVLEDFRVRDYQHMCAAYKVTFIQHKTNKGLPSARNTALRHSTGDIIMLLDTDDTFAPHRIQNQVSFMDSTDADLVCGGYKILHDTFLKPGDNAPTVMPGKDIRSLLFSGVNPCPCGSIAFRRAIWEDIGGFDESMLTGAEDYEFLLRVAMAGYKIEGMKECLYYLGQHSNNMTAKLVINGGFKRAYDYINKKHHLNVVYPD